jgi:hypothetical protein
LKNLEASGKKSCLFLIRSLLRFKTPLTVSIRIQNNASSSYGIVPPWWDKPFLELRYIAERT